MEIVVRAERQADFKAISEVNDAAFGQAEESALIINLRKKKDYDANLSLVAVDTDTDRIVGHILFYPIKIKGDDGEFLSLSLAPVSVLPELQRKEIGTKLVEHGLISAATQGYKSVIVMGHVNFYPRFGFLPASTWGIKCSFDVTDEAFMALELIANGLHGTKGIVIYPKEFDDV